MPRSSTYKLVPIPCSTLQQKRRSWPEQRYPLAEGCPHCAARLRDSVRSEDTDGLCQSVFLTKYYGLTKPTKNMANP